MHKGRNPTQNFFLCENEKWLKEVTIISKGNDKNNEHFLDFSENLVSQKDLQLVEEKQNKEKVGSIEINCQTAIMCSFVNDLSYFLK